MTAETFLSSAVEAAIGMAGFAGIVTAVRHRGLTDWPHGQRILLRMLLTSSAAAFTFAILPPALAEAGLSEAGIWRAGSAGILVFQVFIALRRMQQFRAGGISFPLPRWLLVWVAAIIGLQALNLVLAAPWPYLLGIFGLLANAFTFFVTLLLDPGDDGTDTGPEREGPRPAAPTGVPGSESANET